MPDGIIGVAWDNTTGPRVIVADKVVAMLYAIVVDQRRKLDALQEANDALLEGLKLKDAELAQLRETNRTQRRSLLSWLGGLER
jgi:hypothetical protein